LFVRDLAWFLNACNNRRYFGAPVQAHFRVPIVMETRPFLDETELLGECPRSLVSGLFPGSPHGTPLPPKPPHDQPILQNAAVSVSAFTKGKVNTVGASSEQRGIVALQLARLQLQRSASYDGDVVFLSGARLDNIQVRTARDRVRRVDCWLIGLLRLAVHDLDVSGLGHDLASRH
jgi:hypothetical protein